MSNLDIIINAKNNTGTTFNDVKSALGEINEKAQGLNNITFGIGNAIKSSIEFGVKAAGVGLAAVGATMTATAAKGIADFAALERGMNEVFTLLPGISRDAMDAMTGDLQSLNKEFGLLSSQSVPALYQAISAGVPADNVFDFLETAQKAAVGGVTDLQVAVDGISSVVNSYGLDVMDATRASDLMFTAVKLGKTDFDQLSRSLFNVIPTAASLGVNFGDVTAALAAMTAQGTPTSVATTQLRQLFVELSKEGTATSKIFNEISGVSFRDFISAGGDTQKALILLEKYAKDSNLGINDLFGSVEAGNAALALTGKGTEAFTRNLGEMDNAAGATEQAYEQMDQGISRSIDKIRASLATMLEQVGEKLQPVFSDLVKWIQENMPTFSSIVVGVFSEIADFAKENLPSALNTLEDGFDNLKDNIIPFTRDILGKLQDAFDYLRDVIIPFATEHFPKFIAGVKNVWDETEPLRQLIGKLVEKLLDLDSEQIKMIAKFAAVVLAIGPVASAISGLVSIFTGTAGLVSAIGTVISWISSATGIIPALGALLNPVGLVVAAVAGLGIAWATDFGGIRTTTIEVTAQIASTISTWSSGVTQRFNDLRTNSQNAFSSMSSSIQSSATNLAAQAMVAFRRFETEGMPIFNRLKDNAISKVGEMARDIPRRFSELVDAGLRVFNVGRWIQAGADIIGGVMEGLARAATAPLRWIENFASSLIGGFTRLLGISSPSQVFDEFGVNIMEGLQNGIEGRSDSVISAIQTISSAIVATAEEAQRLADRNFQALLDTARTAYNGAAVMAGDLSNLTQGIDAAAIAAQNAAHQAYVDSLTPAPPATDSGFGTGRVAQLTSQIVGIVRTTFEQVGNTGIRSLGIDLSQFANAGQLSSAIDQIRLLAGTIQQNAQVAPDVNDRNRLQSLYSDVTRRIIPLLQGELERQSAAGAEAAAEAAAESAARQEAATPFFEILARNVGQFASETWGGVQRLVFSQSGWANLAQDARDAVLGIIQEGQAGLVNMPGIADAVNLLQNVSTATSSADITSALTRLVDFRNWFNSLIEASGFAEQIRAANTNNQAGFTNTQPSLSSIINNFNMAYSTLQSSESILSDVDYLNALYGATP